MAQKGIGSLNDPCDCMQHHDFWMSLRMAFDPVLGRADLPEHMFDPESHLHRWAATQSCMYSPENEEAHRPTALSDCIPGFIVTHIICMQRYLVERRPRRSLAYAAEISRLLPWGVNCIDGSSWPITVEQVTKYYRLVEQVSANAPLDEADWPEDLVRAMAWRGLGPREIEQESAHDFGESAVARFVEETDACPLDTIADSGVCWTLGMTGQACQASCAASGLQFRAPLAASSSPLVPRLLSLVGLTPLLRRQHAWEAHECYVLQEARFHDASPDLLLHSDGSWSYPICNLACPCGVPLPSAIDDVLIAVQPLPNS